MKSHSPWYNLTIADTLVQMNSVSTGLTDAEAQRRLAENGLNELQAAQHVSPWDILFEQFKNVLVIILLIAVGLSAVLGHEVEAIAITVIVLFAILLGFVQEYRAERAIEALSQMAAPTATVLRDNVERKLPARQLVPGDVVLLAAGDKIPADGRLIEAINLQADESALTGESASVTKQTEPLINDNLAVGDRSNMVFSGTVVTYGRGLALVVTTGMQTEFGKVAQLLQSIGTSKTPLQNNLDKLGKTIARAVLVIVAIIVALGLFRGQPFIEMFIFGIALAVAAVPEALPAVVTISLAIGVQRMVKRNALVRRLPAVETLGSISVICSDKTGTLTRNEMTVRRIYAGGESFDVTGTGYEPHGSFTQNGSTIEPTTPLRRLLQGAALASDAKLFQIDDHWQIKGDPTEAALVVAAAKASLTKPDLEQKFPRSR